MPTTYTLTIDVHGVDGKPTVGARVEAVLVDRTTLQRMIQELTISGEVVWPVYVSKCTDENGEAQLALVPTSMIEGGNTFYAIAVDGQLLGYHNHPNQDIHWSDVAPVQPPSGDHNSYIVVSDTPTITLTDIPPSGFQGNAGPVPAFTGQKYLLFLRDAAAGAFQELYLYAQGARNTQNMIGAWNQQADAIDIVGTPHYILASDGPLSAPSGYTLWLEVV